MAIGPQLPPHLARGSGSDRATNDPVVQSAPAAPPRDDEDDDEDDFGPALPPDLQQDRERSSHTERTPTAVAGPQLPPHLARSTPAAAAGPSRGLPTLGPTLPPPHGAAQYSAVPYDPGDDAADDSDGEVGPLPAPVGQLADNDDGVQLFREREERERRKQQEEAEDKKPKREEWMLVPPKEMDLLSCEWTGWQPCSFPPPPPTSTRTKRTATELLRSTLLQPWIRQNSSLGASRPGKPPSAPPAAATHPA